MLQPAFSSRVGYPGYITPKQYELLAKTLNSHLFTEDERVTITSSMDFYTVDEAMVNIDWTLAELPKRRALERVELAKKLYELVTQSFYELGEERAKIYYAHCDKASTEKLKKLIEEVNQIYKNQSV